MKVSRSHTTPQFEKDYVSLPINLQPKARRKVELFESDCFNRSLDTHKLKGALKNLWSFSVNDDYRVIFRFLPNHEVIYYRIGPHRVYGELEQLLR